MRHCSQPRVGDRRRRMSPRVELPGFAWRRVNVTLVVPVCLLEGFCPCGALSLGSRYLRWCTFAQHRRWRQSKVGQWRGDRPWHLVADRQGGRCSVRSRCGQHRGKLVRQSLPLFNGTCLPEPGNLFPYDVALLLCAANRSLNPFGHRLFARHVVGRTHDGRVFRTIRTIRLAIYISLNHHINEHRLQ